MVKSIKNPKENKEGVFIENLPAQIVASQLNTLIPVGIAIIIVDAIK